MTIEELPAQLKRGKPKLVERPEPEELLPIIEAVLFVADTPIEIAALARTVNAPRAEVEGALKDLAAGCHDRGVRLQRSGELVQLVSAPRTAPWVERFLGLEHPPLTNASLETLAIIAYRQPMTRTGLEAVRGVDCDGPVRTLMARGLIEEIGRAPLPGLPVLFGTTMKFLEYFGIEKPDDLPPLPVTEDEDDDIDEEDEAAI
jgi:segregation and condensation protein B